ncbi:MAG: hypothetical protein HUU20_04445 [Pirellulales bacterium]|nr:hypothetical protein [Pirellulales bacterium]
MASIRFDPQAKVKVEPGSPAIRLEGSGTEQIPVRVVVAPDMHLGDISLPFVVESDNPAANARGIVPAVVTAQ